MTRLIKLAIFLLGFVSLAYAQYGKVTGKVVDAKTGEPIVAAAVYLEEIGIGTYTDDKGEFILLRVPPGTYTLRVEFTGYSPFVLKNLVVEADRTITPLGGIIKLQETGVVLQEQVVIAREPIIKKDLTASVDKIRSEKLQNLPVVNVEQALQLQAGVRRYGGLLQIRGGRVGEVAYVVDGADLRDPYNNARTPNLPLNAISEISVNKGGFGAEYGNAASGVVEVVTKEGTDKYEFQLRSRTSNFSFLNNIYIGKTPFGQGLAKFLSSSEGHRYARFLSKRYMSDSLYNSIYGYEILRQKKYQEMNFKSDDPLFSNTRLYYTNGMPFAETYYNMKPDLNRFEFTASGPIIKKYLRFSGSLDIQSGNGRFNRLNKGEGSLLPNRYQQYNYQFKLTALPTPKIKLFGTIVGTNSLNSYWDPAWLIAPSHLNTGTKFDYRGYIGGINYLWSPKTYIEIRASRYITRIVSNVFEDININGIDDFADRDEDGYIEIDTFALSYKLALAPKTYEYPSQCQELLNAIRSNQIKSQSTGIPGVVEVRQFWWNDLILNCYPQDRENISLVVGITANGDTVTTTIEENPSIIIKDTLFKISNLDRPTPLTYNRDAFSWSRNYTDQIKLDYVAQDFFNLKNHEVRAGFEFRDIKLKLDEWDFASGANIYPNVIDANPKVFAFYVRDKLEFEGLIANVGLRLDYFDPNAYMPSDLEVPIKDKYLRNFTGSVAPDSLGGVFTWDEGYGVRRDTLLMLNPVKVKPVYYISPRIGISHPISENDVLHFTYGHYFQVPRLFSLYFNQWWIMQGAYPIAGNPSLKPEKTISYELGIRHAFNPYTYIDITGYYKDIYDLIQTKRVDMYVFGTGGVKVPLGKWYTMFVNEDYASVRGIEVQLSKQLGGFLPFLFFDFNYTFQVARGSNSSPTSNYINEYYGLAPGFTQEYYLDWDQRHGIVFNIGFLIPNIPNNAWIGGWGTSLIYTYGAAQPYSPPLRSPRDVLELTNSLRFYGQNNIDMNIYKLFNVRGAEIRLFANIYNLLNDKELITYSNLDYWLGFGPNAGYVCDPNVRWGCASAAEGAIRDISVYNAPRNTEIGIEINWRR